MQPQNPKTEPTVEDGAKEDDKILELAVQRFQIAEAAWRDIRQAALEDMKFGAGEQWDPKDVQNRKDEERPCVTVNRMNVFIRQVVNDLRQNRQSGKISPVDDKGDVETAEILQGMVRQIDRSSCADIAYDTGAEGAARGGFGYWRIVTEFASPMAFNQEIRIKRIRNPFSVLMDPYAQEPDGSDANWGFIFEDIQKSEFKNLYGESRFAQADADWSVFGMQAPQWAGDDTVRVAEYFYKDYRNTVICLLSDGTVVEESQIRFAKQRPQLQVVPPAPELEEEPSDEEPTEEGDELQENPENLQEEEVQPVAPPEPVLIPLLPPGVRIVTKRKTQIPEVKWCKINGCEILERTDWLGSWIPIVPVYGQELDINGKLILESVIRHAKDPQRIYNVLKSHQLETIGLAPKNPWIVEETSIKGHQAAWKMANRRSQAYLPYRAYDDDGKQLPAPQRQVYEPPIQAVTQAALGEQDDMKATTGLFDGAIGARSNETSGRAINARASQAQTSNFHFADNLARSMRHSNRIVVELIPKIYDAATAIRIIGEDGKEETLQIGKMFQRNGRDYTLDLNRGKYDVAISSGPTYETKRQESQTTLLELAKTNPQIMQAAPDLVVETFDFAGAQGLSKRLKKTIDPKFLDEKPQQVPPEIQGKLEQYGQIVDQLTAQLNETKDALRMKSVEIESRERIEMAKIQRDYELKMAELDAADSRLILETRLAQIESRLGALDFDEEFDPDQSQNFEAEGAGGQSALPPEEQEQPIGGPSPSNLSVGDHRANAME